MSVSVPEFPHTDRKLPLCQPPHCPRPCHSLEASSPLAVHRTPGMSGCHQCYPGPFLRPPGSSVGLGPSAPLGLLPVPLPIAFPGSDDLRTFWSMLASVSMKRPLQTCMFDAVGEAV